MDCVVRSWLYGTLSSDLVDIVLARSAGDATVRSAWIAIEAQFLGKREVQGDLYIIDYCKQFKRMAADLGETVQDRTLVLNVIRGLNEWFASIGRHLRRGRPFPTFIEVCDELILEELTMASPASASSTALLAGSTSGAPSGRASGQL